MLNPEYAPLTDSCFTAPEVFSNELSAPLQLIGHLSRFGVLLTASAHILATQLEQTNLQVAQSGFLLVGKVI